MRPPMKPLKPLDEALADLLAEATPLPEAETVTTFDADGRVLAQNCVSALQVPPQDNSSMDGYAVRCADVAAVGVALPITLPVSQRIAAGSAGDPLLPGTAARIFTGAPVPEGADAILMQEDCEPLANAVGGEGLGQVRINAVPRLGQWIRNAGEDITRGRWCCRQAHASARPSLGWPPASVCTSCRWLAARVWRCSPRATNSSCPARCRPS